MSFPPPEPRKFNQAARLFDRCKPIGANVDRIDIVQTGNNPEWSVNYSVSGFLPPQPSNITAARQEFQHRAPRGSIVGTVSVCIIKPGGLIISKWQVHYIVTQSTRSRRTSSDSDRDYPPSLPDRHRSDEDLVCEEQANLERLASNISEEKEVYTRTHNQNQTERNTCKSNQKQTPRRKLEDKYNNPWPTTSGLQKHAKDDIKENDFVSAVYDNRWFSAPLVIGASLVSGPPIPCKYYHLQFIEIKGTKKFQWPDKKDEVLVLEEDILCQVNPPIPVSSRHLGLNKADHKKFK